MTEWTKEMPTDTGWYWFRRDEKTQMEVVYCRGDMFLRTGSDFNCNPRRERGEWWPEALVAPGNTL